MDYLTHLLEQYGYAVLFTALLLEMLALPLPGEFLMSYAGLIVYQGQLNWLTSIVVAGLGVCLGMTSSYLIGYRLGRPFFEKHGRRFHLGPDKLDRVSGWFQRYGNKLLIIAYFIPGVRHITGYFSGVTRLPFRKYAAFAYPGAFIWVTVFITLGKLLGPKWTLYHHTINRYMIGFGITTAIVFMLIYLYRNYKERLKNKLSVLIDEGYKRYRTMGKVKFVVIAAFAVFVTFLSLMIGLIQDLLAHELALFDEVARYIIHRAFSNRWNWAMSTFGLIGSAYFLIPLIITAVVWIWVKGKNRLLELTFFAVVIIGGELLDEGLRLLFHRPGPIGSDLLFTFPSEQSFISLTIYGFAAYLLFRHSGRAIARISAVLIVIVMCLAVGISRIYFDIQYPSDVAAGYVFGGTWLSLNVIVLEILRMIRNDK